MTERRTDVGAMWDSLDRQLEQLPVDLEQERDEFYSQPEWDVYRLHYTGLDWLAIPSFVVIPNP